MYKAAGMPDRLVGWFGAKASLARPSRFTPSLAMLVRAIPVFLAASLACWTTHGAQAQTAKPAAPVSTAPAAGSPSADSVATVAGVWELTNAKTNRSCRISLGAGKAAQGYVLGAPPACRAAIATMVRVTGWTIGQDRTISFIDAGGATVADFKADSAGRFVSATPERLIMVPVGAPNQGTDRTTAVSNAIARANTPDLPPLSAEGLFGLYGVARDKGRPICSIELTSRPAARRGQYVAILSGGCIDSGLKLFDPVAWYTDKGRLHLVARKGHEQSFAQTPDKVFEKNPPSGAQIYLKKQ